MIKCPYKKHPDWIELERIIPEQAYVVWDAFPHGIDKAPNGADSKLFSDLLSHFNGDREAAIKAKAKTVTQAFKTWFGDWTKSMPITNTDIVYGHPGIGKTSALERGNNSFIDWDTLFNEKRDKWIENKSGTKKGTKEYKEARNEYLVHPEKHQDYIMFLTKEWNSAKEYAREQGKPLFASPHTLLKLFPEDFTKIINVEKNDFIDRKSVV